MSSSLGSLFGSPHVPTVAPPTPEQITQQSADEANSKNASLLQAIAQQNRFGFRNQATTAAGVGPSLGPDQ